MSDINIRPLAHFLSVYAIKIMLGIHILSFIQGPFLEFEHPCLGHKKQEINKRWSLLTEKNSDNAAGDITSKSCLRSTEKACAAVCLWFINYEYVAFSFTAPATLKRHRPVTLIWAYIDSTTRQHVANSKRCIVAVVLIHLLNLERPQ